MMSVVSVLAFVCAACAFLDHDPWFSQWPETDRYLASDGSINRIPLRLAAHETIIYGAADLDMMLEDFADEDWTPVTVGGKAAVQIWLNNFTDTDCGPADQVNPYHETWFSLPVTKKSAPLDLPYSGPASYAVADPRANVFVMRVICGSAFGDMTQPMAAISGGREVWGFPKSHIPADIRYDYSADGNYTMFSAEHQGLPVISARVKLPESVPGAVKIPPQTIKTANNTCVTPRWSPKQSRYGEAYIATIWQAPWDDSTDELIVHGEDEWYGKMLKRWNFQPALKAHSTDFRIAAFKPSGWLGPSNHH
jgi:hypothetical protein